MAAMEPKDLGGPPPSPKPPKPMGSLPPAVAPPRARSPRSEPPPPVVGSLIGGAVKAAALPVSSPENAISEQLEALDQWARANRRGARRAVARFCLLKGPAFVCVVAALVAEALAKGEGVIVLTAIAAVAIAIDAAWSGPSSQAHKRAIADIKELESTVKVTWDKIRIAHPDPRDPARSTETLAILDSIQNRREAIKRSLAGRQEGPSGEPQS